VKAAEYVVVSGKPSKADLESCFELGATVAAQLMERVRTAMLANVVSASDPGHTK